MRSFADYARAMDEVSRASGNFRHRSEIPADFAMAVYRVMHNQATASDWEAIDVYPVPMALHMIEMILVDNNTPRVKDEIEWWRSQLQS